ncbi:MAG: hypothetical protein KTR35_15565 [Gammaproteobacteria bacterium]|nr:hypothetical protein [Gammaproteobacteria bacterium]
MNTLRPTSFYRIAAICLLPAYAIHALLRANKDGGRRYFKERFGVFSKDSQPRTWIHTASVGEVLTAQPLIKALLEKHPDRYFLITTNTPTGYGRVKTTLIDHYPDQIIHRYLPIDVGFSTQRMFKQHTIKESYVVETELWPWLYAQAATNQTPITIINARLTAKTLKASKGLLGSAYRRALGAVRVLARSATDAANYNQIGVQHQRITTIGDLKFADNRSGDERKLIDMPYCIAASTHPDEELQLARAWLTRQSDQLLVIAPRHVERGEQLHKSLTELCQDLNMSGSTLVNDLRSDGAIPSPDSKLYLADTLGELASWYAFAQAAFVGGSLVDRGGHNVLEPMFANCPIVVGPHTKNFPDAVAMLEQQNAIEKCANAEDVVDFLQTMALNPDQRQIKKAALKQAALSIDQILVRYLDHM